MSILEKFIFKQEKQKEENILHGKPLKVATLFNDGTAIYEEVNVTWGGSIIYRGDNFKIADKLIKILTEKNINPDNLTQENIEELLEENKKK